MTHAQLTRIAQSLGKLVQKELPPHVHFVVVVESLNEIATESNVHRAQTLALLCNAIDKLENEVKR